MTIRLDAPTRVLRVLEQHGPVAPRELRTYLPDLLPVTIRSAVNRLRSHGLVSEPHLYAIHDQDLVQPGRGAGVHVHEMVSMEAVQLALKSAAGVCLAHQMTPAEAEDLAHRLRENATKVRMRQRELPHPRMRRKPS